MIDLDDWRSSYEELHNVGVHTSVKVEGVCKKVLGGRALYAGVELHFRESTELVFLSELSDTEYKQAYEEGWLRGIYLGVLDIMLVKPIVPVTAFSCTVNAIRFHEVDSSVKAFRLAGRYATEKYLEQEEFVTI
ncbi:MAG: hypothetical protein ACRBHB_06545 [Arenicella sp.]